MSAAAKRQTGRKRTVRKSAPVRTRGARSGPATKSPRTAAARKPKAAAPRQSSAAPSRKSTPTHRAGGGQDILSAMRAICLALPDTRETLTWGEPHFRVGDKIFAGCSFDKGPPTIGFKLEMDHADAIIGDPRFTRAPYVGHKGWVSMDALAVDDWEEVRPLIVESYRLIAPKRSWAKVEQAGPLVGQAAPQRKSTARRTAVRPPASRRSK